LITDLSRLPELKKVKSRDAVFPYKADRKDTRTAGRELGVGAVQNGRVTERNDDLSIAVELVRASENTVIWRDQYNRKMRDTLTVEQDISRGVSDKLRLKLTGEERGRLSQRAAQNPEAYQLYLKGRYQWNRRTEGGLPNSVALFQQAIEKDPRYAQAWAGLATRITCWPVIASLNPRTLLSESSVRCDTGSGT
jgi:hypothetical protein